MKDIDWHTAQIITVTRKLFADGEGTIEDALDAVMEAARREFGVRVLVRNRAEFLVDGYSYSWPVDG